MKAKLLMVGALLASSASLIYAAPLDHFTAHVVAGETTKHSETVANEKYDINCGTVTPFIKDGTLTVKVNGDKIIKFDKDSKPLSDFKLVEADKDGDVYKLNFSFTASKDFKTIIGGSHGFDLICHYQLP